MAHTVNVNFPHDLPNFIADLHKLVMPVVGINPPQIDCFHRPVSYTHLDVYKRQLVSLLPVLHIGAGLVHQRILAVVVGKGVVVQLSLIHI